MSGVVNASTTARASVGRNGRSTSSSSIGRSGCSASAMVPAATTGAISFPTGSGWHGRLGTTGDLLPAMQEPGRREEVRFGPIPLALVAREAGEDEVAQAVGA